MVSRLAMLVVCVLIGTQAMAQDQYSARTVASDLGSPWEVLWGPDNMLWVSERVGRISRIDPETGESSVILDRRDIMHKFMEGGLLGLALHPDFPDSPYVYTGYVADLGGSTPTKLYLRYRYEEGQLTDSLLLMEQAEASAWHQGGRMVVGPDRKLYITNGELPRQDLIHDSSSVFGKLLRMNLDGSVPADNPVAGSYMWSSGHRNAQGLCFLPNGDLYSSEHGPDWDDEVNKIVRGGNYGWPSVIGPADEPDEIAYQEAAGSLDPVWATGDNTYALCGMKYYGSSRYPALTNSLLLVSLKHSRMTQLSLNEEMTEITGVRDHFEYRFGRLRDVCVSPDGRVFLATSRAAAASGSKQWAEMVDEIIEVTLITDTAVVGVPAGRSDTSVIECRVGDFTPANVYIRNVGDGPLRVVNAYCVGSSGVMWSATTLIPFEIEPGSEMYATIYYSPKESGPHHDQVIFDLADGSRFFVPVRGETEIGYLQAYADTIRAVVKTGTETEVFIPVSNAGVQPVQFHSFDVSGGLAAEFSVARDYDREVPSQDTIMVPIMVTPAADGLRAATFTTVSSSYKEVSFTVLIDAREVVSVSEDRSDHGNLRVVPHPVEDVLHVTMPAAEPGTRLEVYNLQGALVHSQPITVGTTTCSIARNTVKALQQPGAFVLVVRSGSAVYRLPVLLGP